MVVTCMAEGSMVLGFSDMLTLGGGGPHDPYKLHDLEDPKLWELWPIPSYG